MRILRNQLGMTLVEVMVVAFVSLIMVAGLSYMVSEVFRSQSKMMESYEIQSVTNLVTLAFRDEATCTGNFQGVVLPTDDSVDWGETHPPSYDVDVTAKFLAVRPADSSPGMPVPEDPGNGGGAGGPGGGGPTEMVSPLDPFIATNMITGFLYGDSDQKGGGTQSPATTTTTTLKSDGPTSTTTTLVAEQPPSTTTTTTLKVDQQR